jgi:glycogen synthase
MVETGNVWLMPSSFAPNLGGVEELTENLARELRTRNVRVLVVTNRWPSDLHPKDEVNGQAVRRFSFRLPSAKLRDIVRWPLFVVTTMSRLIALACRQRPSIVHVQCVSSNGLYAFLIAKVVRAKLVVSLQGEYRMDSTQIYERSVVMRFILRELLQRAQVVTGCSQSVLSEVAEVGLKRRRLPSFVVHNGVDVGLFEGAKPELRDRRFIFATGRLVRQKGFDLLVEAFAKGALADEYELVIGGEGPEQSALVASVNKFELGGSVSFVGRVDRLRTACLMRGCEFFVLPSRMEPFGIVNLEAMAAGRAIVATNVGGVAEVVQNGVTGLLVTPTVDGLRAGMIALASDADLRCRLSSNGTSAVRRFDWTAIADEYWALYTDRRENA